MVMAIGRAKSPALSIDPLPMLKVVGEIMKREKKALKKSKGVSSALVVRRELRDLLGCLGRDKIRVMMPVRPRSCLEEARTKVALGMMSRHTTGADPWTCSGQPKLLRSSVQPPEILCIIIGCVSFR